jgi:hypothetical protein
MRRIHTLNLLLAPGEPPGQGPQLLKLDLTSLIKKN